MSDRASDVESIKELLAQIREACGPSVWSRGVELARQDTVTGDAETSEEIVLRVHSTGTAPGAVVRLFLADADWHCSCKGAEDPCPHVAAAIISLKRARDQGKSLPSSTHSGGKVIYRFSPTPSGLALERFVSQNGSESLLTVSLTAMASGRAKGPPVTPTSDDIEAELLMGEHTRGIIPAAIMPRLLKILSRNGDVHLDGKPIAISAEVLGLVAEVTDDGPGVRLIGKPDPEIIESWKNNAVRSRKGLHPFVMPRLSPAEEVLLRQGQFFGPRDFGDFLSAVLPALEEKIKVRIQSTRLPGRAEALRPRLEIETQTVDETLVVESAIVYGDPVLARVRDGRLSLLSERVPMRDLEGEQRLKEELQREMQLKLGERVSFKNLDAVNFVSRLERFRGEVCGTGKERFKVHAPLLPVINTQTDHFGIAFYSESPSYSGQFKVDPNQENQGLTGSRHADPMRVFAAWQAGESLVPLLEGGYAPLPAGWMAQHGQKVLELLRARAERGELPKSQWPALGALCGELGVDAPSSVTRLREKLLEYIDYSEGAQTPAPAVKLPAGFVARLRAYQEVGVRWLTCLRSLGLGALLADDMGLGKTIQTIALLERKTLVIAPTSVVFNWCAEIKRFYPELKVSLYHGNSRKLDLDADVVVTTYGLLRIECDTLADVNWPMLVLDEAHAIKNPDSLVAQAARRLQADFRLCLSGTPVENRLEELWSIMEFLNPGVLGTRADFREHYVNPISRGESASAMRLQARIKPFILRRLKRIVAPELPPRTDLVLHVELSPEERAQYEAVRAATRKDVVARLDSGATVMELLEALLRLRQASCHPDLLPGVSGRSSSKLALLIDTLDQAVSEGHKALVFSQWTSFLDLMEPALKAAGLRFIRLDGTTADRESIVRQFQDESGPPVLIMSLKAGGVGLNLTAADHVIIADPWWNPAAEDQAADRAHRIGQQRPVLVQRLVALDTVEEKILALQESKRQLASTVVAGSGDPVQGGALTRSDLLALLGE